MQQKPHKIEICMLLIAAALIGIGMYYFGPSITGLLIKESSYTDELNLVITSSGNYTWQLSNIGDLKSVKIDGKVTNYGKARVYIEGNGIRYLIFDSTKIGEAKEGNESENLITGFAAKEEEKDKDKDKDKDKKNESETPVNETPINQTPEINITIPDETINQTPAINETINETLTNITLPINETQNETISINNSISIELAYKSGTTYDSDDNGEESVNGVVDLAAENTQFNWDADKSKVCTRWEIYNYEEGQLTSFCNGNSDCCAFAGLLPTKASWDEVYYSAFGKDGAGHENIVSAQVLYYDVNLSIDNPKSEIYFSSWANKSVKFLEEETVFFGKCIETCSLNGLNRSSYTLILEIEDGAILRIDKIRYSVLADVQNNAPILLQNFSTLNVVKNQNTTINLSQYFSDPDGDELSFSYYKPDNITILFENDAATIVADKEIDGIRYTYLIANDTENIAVSNLFVINISEEKIADAKFFEIRDSLDKKLAVFDSLGNLKIKGVLTQNTEPIADDNDFVIEGLNGLSFVVTNPEGNMLIRGSLSEEHAQLITPPNSFIIQNKDNETMAYADAIGNLFLKGSLTGQFLFD